MKKYILLVLVVFSSAITVFAQQGFTGAAQQGFMGQTAQTFGPQGFVGPTAGNGQPVMISRAITVNEARALPHDSFVVLNGNIINMLPGGKNYTFRDSSGEIIADIGPKHWRGLAVSPSDNVALYGEVKINRGQAHIKVHAISGPGRIHTRPGQPVFITQPTTISEAVNLPHDSFVILNGNIVSAQPRKNTYTFRDSSGEIIVDIGQKHWRGLSVGVSDNVQIYGEVKVNRGGLITIKVHAIRGL